jgi:hypothetical protein
MYIKDKTLYWTRNWLSVSVGQKLLHTYSYFAFIALVDLRHLEWNGWLQLLHDVYIFIITVINKSFRIMRVL